MTGTAASLDRVDGSWAQAPWTGASASHALNGADRTYEQITEVPAITIPRAGVWQVDYCARAAVSVPAAGAEYVTTALYKNGVIMQGTEILVAGISSGGQATGAQATGSHSFIHQFAAGDVVTLWAYRIGQTGSAALVSNGDGRTRVAAIWLGPEGDTAS